LLWRLIDKTVLGSLVRAGVDCKDIVLAMGVNINLVFAGVFALGTGLAGLAGVVAAPILGIYSRMGASILIITFIVVVIGGMGNFRGSFFASLIIGLIDTFAQAYFPELQLFAVYIVLALVTTLKPGGIFSPKEVAV